MIDKETLQVYAKINNLKPWQQEKHYIQSLILNSLAETPVVFKGETYLWFFHNLNRFSEDLDFTANNGLSENLPQRISKELELLGVENKLKIISNNKISLSFSISARGPLNTSERDLCHVYVEISKREKVLMKGLQFKLDFPAYQLPVKIINCMNLNEIISEKIRAILTRAKARDLYDIYYLIKNKNVKFNIDLINKKLKYYNKTFSKELFLKKLQNAQKYYYKELKQLIYGKIPDYKKCFSTIKTWIK